jgi:transposase
MKRGEITLSKNQRIWTDEEDLFVTVQYGRMTLQKIGEHLNRSKESVNKRISRLKIRTEETRLRKNWTDDQDTFLKENIDTMSNREIGEHLGKVASSVVTRIKVLNLEWKEKVRRWTDEEDDYLLNHYGSAPLKHISESLQRTVKALESRLNRLGVYGAKANTINITVYELAEGLQVDVHTVYNWIKNNKMPYKKIVAKTREFMLIDVLIFWGWIEQNRGLINFYKVPKNALVPEPDWVDKQRDIDYLTRPRNENKNWSEEEDARLRNMFYGEGRTQKEIGELMGRSARGIQKRLDRLRKTKVTG